MAIAQSSYVGSILVRSHMLEPHHQRSGQQHALHGCGPASCHARRSPAAGSAPPASSEPAVDAAQPAHRITEEMGSGRTLTAIGGTSHWRCKETGHRAKVAAQITAVKAAPPMHGAAHDDGMPGVLQGCTRCHRRPHSLQLFQQQPSYRPCSIQADQHETMHGHRHPQMPSAQPGSSGQLPGCRQA